MTKENRLHLHKLIELKKAGQFRATWTPRPVGAADAAVNGDPSMCRRRCRSASRKSVLLAPVTLKNGRKVYRLVQRHGPDEASVGKKLTRYDYLNCICRAGRAASSTYGYYSRTVDGQKFPDRPSGLLYDGKPAPSSSTIPRRCDGKSGTKPTAARSRPGQDISCWIPADG